MPLRNIVLTLLPVAYPFLPFLAYTFLHFRPWKLNVLPYTLTLGCALWLTNSGAARVTVFHILLSISKAARE
jgi:hypothetical protein